MVVWRISSALANCRSGNTAPESRTRRARAPRHFRARTKPRYVPHVLDALVLLGCRIGPQRRLTDAAERRVEAALLARSRGLARIVIVSGGRLWHGISEAEALAAALEARGVPRSEILLELASLSTCENAYFSVELARRHGLTRLGVVTSAWHMPRALASFRSAGGTSVPLPTEEPRVSWLEQLRRGLRERASFCLDHLATFGVGSS